MHALGTVGGREGAHLGVLVVDHSPGQPRGGEGGGGQVDSARTRSKRSPSVSTFNEVITLSQVACLWKRAGAFVWTREARMVTGGHWWSTVVSGGQSCLSLTREDQ